jgi:ribosomal protein S27E
MSELKEPESMDECHYFSRRALDNGHKFTIWVPKDAITVMHVKYTCGKCKHIGIVTSEYSLPFTFTCEKCSAEIRIEPLKGKSKGIKKKKPAKI